MTMLVNQSPAGTVLDEANRRAPLRSLCLAHTPCARPPRGNGGLTAITRQPLTPRLCDKDRTRWMLLPQLI